MRSALLRLALLFLSEGAPSEVRRVALCLRLTIYATSLTAEKDKRGEPTLVSLGRGVVQEKTSMLFSDIVSRIPDDPVLEPTETLLAMLQTQVHLIIRFDQYERFPTRLWRLTKKFNPEGYADACYQFLTAPNEDLDLGFSVLLKEEAWQGGRTEAEALDWLQGAEAQALLSWIFESTAATSLDIERKHAVVKAAETTKVSGCSRASRNSILQRYQVRRKQRLLAVKKNATKKKNLARCSIRSIAIAKNPQWLSRGQGQLRQNAPLTRRERRQVVHEGDEAALKAFIDAHRDELLAELRAAREAAAAEGVADKGLPVTRQDWVTLLESDGRHAWDRCLASAHVDRRRYSTRVRARADLGDAPRVYRKLSHSAGHAPCWSYLRAGVHCFVTAAAGRFWCYLARIGSTVYVVPLSVVAEAQQKLALRLDPPLNKAARPIGVVFRENGVPNDTTTASWQLEVKAIAFHGDRVVLEVLGAERSVPPARRVAQGEEVEEEEEEESASLDWMRKLAGIGPADASDEESVVSDDEQSSLAVSEEEPDSDEGSGGERAAAGTHVVAPLSNQYFTFINNKGYPDVKVVVRRRWRGELGLGSKTVTPAKVGDMRENPTRSYLVLRAWALAKFTSKEFHKEKSIRRKFVENETRELRAAILAMTPSGTPTTGNREADQMIRSWLPELLL
jgi:hypothetical protein